MKKRHINNRPVTVANQKTVPLTSQSRYYLFLCIVILFFASIRVRLRDVPLERDEGEYAYAGQLILQGIAPYQLAYNMKFPGTYAAYSIILAIFGQTPAAVHDGLLIVNVATILLIYLLATRIFDPLAGCTASTSYALLSSSPSVMGFAGHATHFVVLFAIASLLILLKASETKKLAHFFWSGLLGGLAFLMKQPGMFFPLFGGLYLIWREWRRPIEWRGLGRRTCSFCLGVLIPLLITGLIIYKAGVSKRFWFWTVSYGQKYATRLSFQDGIDGFWSIIPAIMGPSFLIWVIAGTGVFAFLWSSKARARMIFVGGFLLFSFLAVCPGYYFREHYFILLLPAISLLAGIAVSSVQQVLSTHGNNKVAILPGIAFLVAFSYAVFQQRDFLFLLDPIAACREVYGNNPFPEALKVADYIKSHTTSESRIAVLGSEPEIYFYSQRHSATGYIYTYGLMEDQEYALQMQEEMIHEIKTAQPEFLVSVDVPTSWLAQPGSPQVANFLTWVRKYIGEQYKLVGIADILDDHTEYRWRDELTQYRPRSQFAVLVYQAKGERAETPVPPLNSQ
jgi:dolichyl-phosphate-mannose-protein mannosyltransferase